MYDLLWNTALNLASLAIEAVVKGLRELALLTGLQPEAIVAAAVGGTVFTLALKFFFAATR